MKLGMIGLGRMGANMATRLLRGGDNRDPHSVVYDRSAEAVAAAAALGAVAAVKPEAAAGVR